MSTSRPPFKSVEQCLSYSTTRILLILFTLFSSTLFHSTHGQAIKAALNANDSLSKFAELATQVGILGYILDNEPCTVFAPTNEAFRVYVKPGNVPSDYIPKLHVAQVPFSRKEDFTTQAITYLAAAPPLNLKKKQVHNDHGGIDHEYYVNNAKIVGGPFQFTAAGGKNQILYLIDEVIEPYAPELSPLKAKAALSDPAKYANLRYEDIGLFLRKIQEYDLNRFYEEEGQRTYLVPIEIDKNYLNDLDETVIRGHIIPNDTLFLRTMDSKVYHSAAWDRENQVELSLDVKPSADSTNMPTYYIQANTLVTSGRHHQGISKVKVYKPNVAVANGVIHFIERPLMIISSTIAEIMEVDKEKFSSFKQHLSHDPSINDLLKSGGGRRTTVFAPTNEAFLEVSERLRNLKHDQVMEIIKLHIVPENAISSEVVRTGTKKAVSLAASKELFFDVTETKGFRVLTVEGGGVNATAEQADIGATNGIVHIINRVLGIPFQSIKEKLEEDGNLRTTALVASKSPSTWLDSLGVEEVKYTLFAPSERAWQIVKDSMPSEYKQLTEGIYPQNSEWILNRHLHVGDEPLTVDKLRNLKTLKTNRGQLEILVDNKNELIIKWDNVEAKVVRSDVHAMNGVIHEIDMVLMIKRDLQVSPAAATMPNSTATIIISNIIPILWFLLIQFM